MEEKSILKKYEEFLKLNHLPVSNDSAKDFTDLSGETSLLGLSMEYVNKGNSLSSNTSKKKYYEYALLVNPRNFAAKICLLELKSFADKEYKAVLKEEYDRLLKDDYLNPSYYEGRIVDFEKYQETFNYLRGLRSYYIMLIGNSMVEEAIEVGLAILELNPKDHFHIESSLPFLYLRENDDVSAISLIHENDQLIPGTKEIILSYAAYLNMDKDKSIEYLSDANAVNPYFYRILTGEEEMTYSFAQEDVYSRAEYLFLNFSLVGTDEAKGYDEIIQESLKKNPLEQSVTKDEWMTLEIMSWMETPKADIDSLKEEAIKHRTPDSREFRNFTDGRIGAAIEALSIQGITSDSGFTPYGEIFYRRITSLYKDKKLKYTKEAMAYFEVNDNEEGRKKLLLAMDMDPRDYELKVLYATSFENFPKETLKEFLNEMMVVYRSYLDYTKYSTVKMREDLARGIDTLNRRIFEEASKHGYTELLKAYSEGCFLYPKYGNLLKMAGYLERDTKVSDTDFYKLYQSYREEGDLPSDLLLKCVKNSKGDYTEAWSAPDRMVYHLIDPAFEVKYQEEVRKLSLADILNESEMRILLIVREGGKDLKDAFLSYEFHTVAAALEKDGILTSDKSGLMYEVPDFIRKKFKEEK